MARRRIKKQDKPDKVSDSEKRHEEDRESDVRKGGAASTHPFTGPQEKYILLLVRAEVERVTGGLHDEVGKAGYALEAAVGPLEVRVRDAEARQAEVMGAMLRDRTERDRAFTLMKDLRDAVVAEVAALLKQRGDNV